MNPGSNHILSSSQETVAQDNTPIANTPIENALEALPLANRFAYRRQFARITKPFIIITSSNTTSNTDAGNKPRRSKGKWTPEEVSFVLIISSCRLISLGKSRMKLCEER